jgi:NAD(P)-dependent dehydrogenase (short-subunit alcohol dehydrogenase family)
MDLNGHCVLVTGSSRGIGRAIAEHLLQHGASVGLHYHSQPHQAAALQGAYPGKTTLHQADLAAGYEACEQLTSEFIQAWNRLDTVVLNAGVAMPSPLSMEADNWEANWDQTMALNLRAPGLLSRSALSCFQQQRSGGRLIFISSRAAFRGDTPDYWAYAASKGGLVSLARSIAKDFGKDGVKSFVVAPGFVATEMAQQFIDTYGEAFVKGDLALDELTQPSDVAKVVTFLASGWGDHATGTTLDVNAGSYLH